MQIKFVRDVLSEISALTQCSRREFWTRETTLLFASWVVLQRVRK